MRTVRISTSGSHNGELQDAETNNFIRCHHQEDPLHVRSCHEDCAAFSIEDSEEDDDDQLACCWGETIGVME